MSFLQIVLFAVGWMALTVCVGVGCDKIECADVGATTGRETKHSVLSGCYVEVDGRMIPRDSWKGETERDGH